MKKTTLLLIITLCLTAFSYGQKKPTVFGKEVSKTQIEDNGGVIRCASTEYEHYLQKNHKTRQTNEEFEAWLAPKVATVKRQQSAKIGNSTQSTNAVYTIPVVVHVVHTGTAVGVGANISDAQVLSQIQVLNEDFRRMANTPGFNSNPVGADTEIQFCLAQRTPNGSLSTGINRVVRPQTNWTDNEIETSLKPSTIWDPTKYLNLWVVIGMSGTGGETLGYAQFPTGSGLPGLGGTSTANTDGVIIGYRYFGSSAIYPAGSYSPPYDRGRTTTHEVGHYLGLRHINGDNTSTASCTVNANDSTNDYCLDTPSQRTLTGGCPIGKDTCPSSPGLDMIENYMDYSNDTCLNIFTLDQKARMVAVMQNSPRRASLSTSNGCTPGQIFGLDGSIEIGTWNSGCSKTFTPTVILKNSGTTTMTSAVISYNIDGGTATTTNWSGSLATNATTSVTLNPLTTTAGTHIFNANVTTVNGAPDQNSENNGAKSFTIAESYTTTTVNFTLQPDYYGPETNWTVTNSAGATLFSGGPYSFGTANSQNQITGLPPLVNETWTLPINDCYTFTINDSGADGICCSYGNGSYTLKTPTNTVIATGGTFASSESKSFGIYALGVNEFNPLDAVYLYPNPANSVLNIAVTNNMELPESYTIYNSLGQEIQTVKVTSEANLSVNTSSYSNGVYLIKLFKDNDSKTLRFIKN